MHVKGIAQAVPSCLHVNSGTQAIGRKAEISESRMKKALGLAERANALLPAGRGSKTSAFST